MWKRWRRWVNQRATQRECIHHRRNALMPTPAMREIPSVSWVVVQDVIRGERMVRALACTHCGKVWTS